MTHVWPGLGVAPVPTLISLICKPDGVVMEVAPLCAEATVGDRNKEANSVIESNVTFAEFVIFIWLFAPDADAPIGAYMILTFLSVKAK